MVDLPRTKLHRKNLTVVGVLVILFAIPLTVVLVGVRQELRKRAETGAAVASAGYPNFVDPSDYGTPGAAIAEVIAASADGSVQNLQAPTISGFSSDLFTGGATVSYPLALPPGRGGLTPSLSFNYSSNSVYGPMLGRDANSSGKHNEYDIVPGERDGEGNLRQNWTEQLFTQSSQIGLGWNLGGLGSVFRDFHNRYTMVLNGQSYRLFKDVDDQGVWLDPKNSWHTDPTGFLKIEHAIVGNDLDNADNFKITDTNGTIYTFEPQGYFWKPHDDGDYDKFHNKWVLTKVEDVHTNEIKISYDVEDQVYTSNVDNKTYPRAINPLTIEYSGSESDFKSRIEFITTNREDWMHLENGSGPDQDGNPRPRDNQFFFSTKRLGKVNVKVKQGADWKIVRQYVLDNDQYFTRPNHPDTKLHPKLTKITARGRDGADALPPYTFEYDSVHNTGLGTITNYRLLTKASNGYGGSVGYNYESYSVMDYDPKTGDWVTQGSVFGLHRVTEKTAHDGRGDSFKTTYDYPESTVGISDDQYHSGFESVGHGTVTVKVLKKNETEVTDETVLTTTVYDFIQGEYHDGNFYVWPERGRARNVKVYEGNMEGLFSESATDYLRDPDDKDNTQNDIWNTAHFIAAKETRACAEPSSPQSLGSKSTYEYNEEDQGGQQWGNLTQTTTYKVKDEDEDPNRHDCNSAASDDPAIAAAAAYRTIHNTYSPNLDRHITNRVTETETIAYPENNRLALAWNSYDDNGSLTLSRAFYNFPTSANSDPSNGTYDTVDSTFGYDGFGNLTTTTTYEGYNQSGDTRTSTIGYETTYNTFPVSATNTLGHTTETRYRNGATLVNHPLLADRTITMDINDQQWTTLVDGFGRPLRTFVPGENTPQTIVDYTDGNPFIVHTQTRDDKDEAGTAVSYHNSWQFYNGLGQVIESQSELEGDATKVVVAASEYNALGQAVKTLIPYESSGGGSLLDPDWTKTHSIAVYDSLGRATESWTPSELWSSSQLDNEASWHKSFTGYYGRLTAVLDPKNHLAVSEVDSLGRALETLAFNKPVASLPENGSQLPTNYYIRTRLAYDHLDRVIETITTDMDDPYDASAKTAVSTVTYNQFGQQTSTTDPDLGEWFYTYDPTGTLLAVKDANTNIGSFKYDDLGRMFEKYVGSSWVVEPDGTVTVGHGTLATSFDYDDYFGCTNSVGRLCHDITAHDPSLGLMGVSTLYAYDNQGRLQFEKKTIEGRDYTTSFAYDAASRQKTITYPDSTSETVAYSYNDAGLLNNVSGAETYLASAEYNVLGMATEEVLGSGVKNTYDYESNTFRLAEKSVENSAGGLWSQLFHDTDGASYYDAVGNILNIRYPATVSNPAEFVNTYTYDDLNRLTEMTSTDLELSASYAYDQLGRMTLKTEEGGEEEPPVECLDRTVVENVDRDTMLVAKVPSEENTFITFNFYNNEGEALFFLADWAVACPEGGEAACYPYTVLINVDLLSEVRQNYPNYEGYVVVESHSTISKPGSADGACVEVRSGPTAEVCQDYCEAFLPADLDCDCRVTVADIMKVAAIWRTQKGGEGFNPDYDFGGDGKIRVDDVMYVAAKWNTKCP